MANLKAMDSDWFAQTYMGRKSKVKTAAAVGFLSEEIHTILHIQMLAVSCTQIKYRENYGYNNYEKISYQHISSWNHVDMC